MHPLARRRCLAHLTDCVGYLGIAAAMVPAGVLVATRTDLGASPMYSYLVSTVPPLLATALAARAESGPRRATWGKRRQGLVVTGTDGQPLGPGAALVRNAAKILVPWQLGHVCAISAAWGGFGTGDPLAYDASLAVYALIGTYAWLNLRGEGQGIHDRLVGARVAAAISAQA